MTSSRYPCAATDVLTKAIYNQEIRNWPRMHVINSRVTPDGVINVERVLHQRMDADRHF